MKRIERNKETSHMPKDKVIRILTRIIGTEPVVSDHNLAKDLVSTNNAKFLEFYRALTDSTGNYDNLISAWEQATDEMLKKRDQMYPRANRGDGQRRNSIVLSSRGY